MTRITQPLPILAADPHHGKRRLLEALEGALKREPPGPARMRMLARARQIRAEMSERAAEWNYQLPRT